MEKINDLITDLKIKKERMKQNHTNECSFTYSEVDFMIDQLKEMVKNRNKVYYLAQPIRHFTKDLGCNDLEEFIMNHKNAFDWAMKYVVKSTKMGITMFSPAIYSCYIAINRFSKDFIDHEKERKIYININNKFINLLRRSGELIWIFHPKWYNSHGCREEYINAKRHNEKCIKLDEFFKNGKEIEIDEKCSIEENKIIQSLLRFKEKRICIYPDCNKIVELPTSLTYILKCRVNRVCFKCYELFDHYFDTFCDLTKLEYCSICDTMYYKDKYCKFCNNESPDDIDKDFFKWIKENPKLINEIDIEKEKIKS